MNRTTIRATGAVAGALLAGLTIGLGFTAFASDTEPKPALPKVQMPDGRSIDAVTEAWPTNEFGLTYGSVTRADQEKRHLPDLVPIRADNGEVGYLLSKEVFLPVPKSDEELLAQQRASLNEAGEEIQNVYSADGKTKIGVATVGAVTMTDEQGRTISPKTGKVIEP